MSSNPAASPRTAITRHCCGRTICIAGIGGISRTPDQYLRQPKIGCLYGFSYPHKGPNFTLLPKPFTMRPSLLTLATIVAFGLFSACSKTGKFNNPGADAHLCNIEKFFLTNYDPTTGIPSTPVEYDIRYDAKGNP